MRRMGPVRAGVVCSVLVATALVGLTPGHAQTVGSERRQDRRDDRQEARDIRQGGRQDARDVKSATGEGNSCPAVIIGREFRPLSTV